MKFHRLALIIQIAVCVSAPLPVFAQTSWSVTNEMHIGGAGSWDYVTVDPVEKRIFLPRSTHTIIVDENSGKILGDIPGQKVAHGVALVPSVGWGFITDGGGDGAIVVFDLKTYAVLGKLAAAPDADGIIYDAKQNLVLAVSGDGGILMTFKPDIDPVNGKIDSPIVLGGAPEFLAADGSGNVFINLEDKDVVAKVDLKPRKVVARWPVAPGGRPVGMSIDVKKHKLFIGCRKPELLVVMSSDNGAITGSLPIGSGVDATRFDSGQAFASCGNGVLFVIGEVGGKFAVEQQVKTQAGARTMDIDRVSHRIYLPTAEFEDAPAGSTGRPKPKPDTFKLIEVTRKM